MYVYVKHKNSFRDTKLEVKYYFLDFANIIALCQLLYVFEIIHNNIVS